MRHARGRAIRSGTPPRSCGTCPRVRRFSFRPLDIQASCSATARIRTAHATSPTFPQSTPARRRNAARIRSADYRCRTPPPRRHSLRRGRPRGIRAPRRLHFSSFSLHPSAFRSVACGSVWLENSSGGTPLAGEGGSLSVGPPAEVLPARSALPRDKRGARNSGQGRGSPVVGRAARLFRLLPAAGAARERGESWESRQVVALGCARTCRLS